MKHKAIWLVLAMTLTGVGGVQAADTSKATVIRDYTDIVAPADQQAYESGIKAFNQCLSQHGFKYTWVAWSHETGDTYSYSYTSEPQTWANFDAMQAAGKACDQAIRTNVNPHLKSETSAFMDLKPELSHMPKGASMESPFIEVVYFKLKPGHEAHEAFNDVVKKITAAAEKSKWPNSFSTAEVRGGGSDAPDYVLVLPAKTWGDLGKDADPPLWTMVANVYGKDDAQAMRKQLNDAVQEESSHIDSYNADLTYKAGGK